MKVRELIAKLEALSEEEKELPVCIFDIDVEEWAVVPNVKVCSGIYYEWVGPAIGGVPKERNGGFLKYSFTREVE